MKLQASFGNNYYTENTLMMANIPSIAKQLGVRLSDVRISLSEIYQRRKLLEEKITKLFGNFPTECIFGVLEF